MHKHITWRISFGINFFWENFHPRIKHSNCNIHAYIQSQLIIYVLLYIFVYFLTVWHVKFSAGFYVRQMGHQLFCPTTGTTRAVTNLKHPKKRRPCIYYSTPKLTRECIMHVLSSVCARDFHTSIRLTGWKIRKYMYIHMILYINA